MSNQCRQVKRAFCKWAPLNQNTEGQLLERGVLSSSNMKKKKTTTQIQKGNEIKGGIKEGKWGEGRDSCCWGGGRTELRNKTSKAATNTSRASLQAGVKGRRWWRDGWRTEGTLKREKREREREKKKVQIAQKWLSWEKKYWFVYVELPVYQRVTCSY